MATSNFTLLVIPEIILLCSRLLTSVMADMNSYIIYCLCLYDYTTLLSYILVTPVDASGLLTYLLKFCTHHNWNERDRWKQALSREAVAVLLLNINWGRPNVYLVVVVEVGLLHNNLFTEPQQQKMV